MNRDEKACKSHTDCQWCPGKTVFKGFCFPSSSQCPPAADVNATVATALHAQVPSARLQGAKAGANPIDGNGTTPESPAPSANTTKA